MLNKKNILFVISFAITMLCLLYNCKQEVSTKPRSHYVDSTLQRTAQIQLCASCHKDVYENWKMDSHSNAYITLENHAKLIDSSKNFPKEYNKFVKERMESVCLACHTGKNLYETNFAGINHSSLLKLLNKDSFPNAYKQAFSREIKDKNNLTSGVDCITCHVQNNQVVTNANSKASDTLGLIKSHFFSSNMNCYSCHHHQVETMNELVASKKLSAEINCVSCHQEYTPKGKGTHYFYWRNDHASKKRPKHLNIFECVKIEIQDKQIVKFNWTNTVMPHGYSECGDAKCVVIAVYKNKQEKMILEQLINRKDFFDERKEMPSHFHTGKNGNDFQYMVPILRQVDLKKYADIDYLKIIGYVKPQYWSTNKEFIEVFTKKVLLTQ